MFRLLTSYLRALDAAHEGRPHFVKLKARLLAGVSALILALVPFNIAKIHLLDLPGPRYRMAVQLCMAAGAVLALFWVGRGRDVRAGNAFVIVTVASVHAIVLLAPDYPQALTAAFQMFGFDLVFLLIALIFAARAVAFGVLALVIAARFTFHARELQAPITGTLEFAAGTMLRDGMVFTAVVFCLGLALLRMIEASLSRSEESLAQSRATRENLERLVAERTRDLEAAIARANEAARVKSDFLANMSHEIRTPLNGVIASAELLQKRDDLPPEAAEHVRLIADSGELLLKQLGDVLDFSKIEAGQVALEAHAFELGATAGDCVALLASQAQRGRVTLDHAIADSLPRRRVGDSYRIRQVLLNLLSNAIKFTPAGGSVRLNVLPGAAGEGDDGVRFEVTDTGIGMSDAAMARIFERFTQADSSTTRRYGGTGLGLAISSRLVAMMGGKLSVRSMPGRGSTFSFTIPLRPAEASDDAGPEGERLSSLGLAVLAAEDNAVNRRLLAMQLERLGCTVRLVGDGEEALAALESGPLPDVVLMDCHMPNLNGWDATRRLRAWAEAGHPLPERRAASKVVVIALTAAALPEERQRCEQAGMDGFLPKPVKLGDLYRALAPYAHTPKASAISVRAELGTSAKAAGGLA